MDYGQHHLLVWLKERPLIRIQGLEEAASCPKGTVRHFLKERRNIPEEYVPAIERILKAYGFKPFGNE